MKTINILMVAAALCICIIPVFAEDLAIEKTTLQPDLKQSAVKVTKEQLQDIPLLSEQLQDVKESLNKITVGNDTNYNTIISDDTGKIIANAETNIFTVEGIGTITKTKLNEIVDITINNIRSYVVKDNTLSVIEQTNINEGQLKYISQVNEDQVVVDNGNAIIPKSSKFYGIVTSKDNPYAYGTDKWYNYEVNYV